MNIAHYIGILKYPNFLKLWSAQICVKLAENMLTFSLIILIFRLTNDNFVVSLLVLLVSIPPILLSAAAGVVADMYNRKTIIVTSNLARFALVLLALAFPSQAVALLGIAFLLSITAQFFSPAEAAAIPALVDKKHLFTANSLYSFSNYTLFLVGYTIAGPIMQRWGATPLFLFVAALYLGSVLLTSWLPPLVEHLGQRAPGKAALFNWPEFRRRLVDGVKYIWGNRITRFVILQVAIVFSIERTFLSLAPGFATDFLKFNLDDISLFLILPTGVGTLAGVLTANRFKHRAKKSTLITTGLALDGLAMLALACWPGVLHLVHASGWVLSAEQFVQWLVVVLAFISGFADPFIIVPAQTALQERTPAEDRGRVFGGLYTFMNLLGLLPLLVIGALTKVVSLPWIVAGLSAVILFAAFQGLLFYRRHSLAAE